jgi:hypothetical protein
VIIKTKSVKHLAKDAGLSDELIERNLDELCEFVFRIAKRERKFCRDRIRAWHFSNDIGKCELFQVLDDETDYDLV